MWDRPVDGDQKLENSQIRFCDEGEILLSEMIKVWVV